MVRDGAVTRSDCYVLAPICPYMVNVISMHERTHSRTG